MLEAGFEVVCIPSGVEELEDDSLAPQALALENARRKLTLVAARQDGKTVLSADTVVSREGRHYGKPRDLDDAFRMLEELAGRTHVVVTGVSIRMADGTCREFFECSEVTFHPLTPGEIRAYLASINPLDKAGGYAAQDDNGEIICEIRGSRTNVIGLPMERLLPLLHQG